MITAIRQNAWALLGEWRSLVAHSAGGRAVAGSNPVSPILQRRLAGAAPPNSRARFGRAGAGRLNEPAGSLRPLLAGERFGLTLTRGVGRLGLEHVANLLTQLGRVLVVVYAFCV